MNSIHIHPQEAPGPCILYARTHRTIPISPLARCREKRSTLSRHGACACVRAAVAATKRYSLHIRFQRVVFACYIAGKLNIAGFSFLFLFFSVFFFLSRKSFALSLLGLFSDIELYDSRARAMSDMTIIV